MRKFIQLIPGRIGYRYDGRYNRVLDFIVRYNSENDGAGPTIREIGAACHISSTSVVNYAVNRLLDSGLIYLTPNGHIGVRGGNWQMKLEETPENEPGAALMVTEDRTPFENVAQALEGQDVSITCEKCGLYHSIYADC